MINVTLVGGCHLLRRHDEPHEVLYREPAHEDRLGHAEEEPLVLILISFHLQAALLISDM